MRLAILKKLIFADDYDQNDDRFVIIFCVKVLDIYNQSLSTWNILVLYAFPKGFMWLYGVKANFYAKVPSIRSKIIEYYLPRPFANAWLKIEIDKDTIVLRNNYTTKPLSNMHLFPLLTQTVKSSLEKNNTNFVIMKIEKRDQNEMP